MDFPPGLAKNPSTGAFIGLSKIAHHSASLENVRTSSNSECSKWFAIATGVGLAYRQLKVYQFAAKYSDCPSHVLEALVVRGMEEYGTYKLGVITDAATALFEEARLFVTCSFRCFMGNSVRYEFGYRWFYQTRYSLSFKESYLDLIGVSPVLLVGSSFQEECLQAQKDGHVEDPREFISHGLTLDEAISSGVVSDAYIGVGLEDPFAVDPNFKLVSDPRSCSTSTKLDCGLSTGVKDTVIGLCAVPGTLASLETNSENSFTNLAGTFDLERLLLNIIRDVDTLLEGYPVRERSLMPMVYDPGSMLTFAEELGFSPKKGRIKIMKSFHDAEFSSKSHFLSYGSSSALVSEWQERSSSSGI